MRLRHWFLPLLVPVSLITRAREHSQHRVSGYYIFVKWMNQDHLGQRLANFFGKGLMINISGFVGGISFPSLLFSSLPCLCFPFFLQPFKNVKTTLRQTLQGQAIGQFCPLAGFCPWVRGMVSQPWSRCLIISQILTLDPWISLWRWPKNLRFLQGDFLNT